jgi:Flp pilus assembly protein TadD
MRGLDKFRSFCLLATVATLAACASAGGADRSGDTTQVGKLTDSAHTRAFYLSVIERLIGDGQAYAALAHLDEFDRAFGIVPQSQRLRGDAWLAVGDLAQAERSYAAITGAALAGYRLNGLGRIAAERRDWPRSADYFAQAVAAAPANAEFLNNLGGSLIYMARYDEAEFALRKARQLAPADDRVISNLLLLLAETDRPERLPEIFSDVDDPSQMNRLRARLNAFVEAGKTRASLEKASAVSIASQEHR